MLYLHTDLRDRLGGGEIAAGLGWSEADSVWVALRVNILGVVREGLDGVWPYG